MSLCVYANRLEMPITGTSRDTPNPATQDCLLPPNVIGHRTISKEIQGIDHVCAVTLKLVTQANSARFRYLAVPTNGQANPPGVTYLSCLATNSSGAQVTLAVS